MEAFILSTVTVPVTNSTSTAQITPCVMLNRALAFKLMVRVLSSVCAIVVVTLCNGPLIQRVLGQLMELPSTSIVSKTPMENAWLSMQTTLAPVLLVWVHAVAQIPTSISMTLVLCLPVVLCPTLKQVNVSK